MDIYNRSRCNARFCILPSCLLLTCAALFHEISKDRSQEQLGEILLTISLKIVGTFWRAGVLHVETLRSTRVQQVRSIHVCLRWSPCLHNDYHRFPSQRDSVTTLKTSFIRKCQCICTKICMCTLWGAVVWPSITRHSGTQKITRRALIA